MKESFVFYKSFYDALQDLKDKDRLKVYDAICNLALNNQDTKLNGIAKTIFTLIKPQVIANNLRYQNGKKGGRPKKETIGFENKKTDGYEKVETETKPNENENENENENVNENENENVTSSNGLGFQHKQVLSLLESNGLVYSNTPDEFNVVDYLSHVDKEIVEDSIERAKIKNKLDLNYILGIVLNKLKQAKKTIQVPEWFNKKIEKKPPTEEEKKELEKLLKF